MLSLPRVAVGVAAITLLAVLSLWAFKGAEARTPAHENKKRIYIELSEDFYRALKGENNKRYTTDKSDEYLRQIAVSSKFMVESNLQILKRQEQIVSLLEQMQLQGGGKP